MKIPFIFILLFFSTTFSQSESVSEIRRTIKEVKAEQERETALMQTEAKRYTAFIENSKQKSVTLTEQEKSLHNQIDSIKSEINELQSKRQKALGTARYFESRKNKYAEDLSKAIDSLAIFEESDYPHKNDEAIAALKDISGQLRKTTISAEAAFGRTWEVLLERVRLGYTTETWSGNLEWEGKKIAGKFFRYKTICTVFISANGDYVLWQNSGSSNKNYKWQSADENITLRAALKETVRVAEGKTAPKLVFIPVP
ncbi:hypothetical protein AGMMS49938_11680 [Fibrobacterales bacterium]|nr:hypothetical protein AGMMS49938_11680 [Fibrobacterales bacterium]